MVLDGFGWFWLVPCFSNYASQYIMQVNNTFTVNVIFCPSKANPWRLKNISCNRNERKTIH